MSAPTPPSGGGKGLAGAEALAMKKVGPLPIIAYIGIGIVGYLLYRRYKGASVPAATTAVDPTTATSGLDSSSNGGSGADTVDTSTPSDGSTVAPLSDVQWEANTVEWLIQKGHSPADASNAIAAYMSGATLTSAQLLLVNSAIGQFGTPPSGVKTIKAEVPPAKVPITQKPPVKPPVKTGPKPTPKPKPKPAPSRTYVVKHGDTLSGIAGRYGTTWQKVYAANKGVIGGNPNVIRPGEKLRIPA